MMQPEMLRNPIPINGVVWDQASWTWQVWSPDMETVMEFRDFWTAVIYAMEVEGWR